MAKIPAIVFKKTYSKLFGTISPVSNKREISVKNAVLVSKKARIKMGSIHRGTTYSSILSISFTILIINVKMTIENSIKEIFELLLNISG